MVTILRFEDQLEGGTNFNAWKERFTLLLEEHEIWDIVKATITVPTIPTNLVSYNKRNIKSNRILLDAMKLHMIMHVTEKTHAYKMWETLTKIFQSRNDNINMVLQKKLHSLNMHRVDSITSYLNRVTQVRHELVVVGENIVDVELVQLALKGFPKP